MLKVKKYYLDWYDGMWKNDNCTFVKRSVKMNWIDMDIYIEDKYQMRISEMFDISEDYFRQKKQNVVWMFLKWKT